MSQRVPTSCPVGFAGRYIVQPGDTLFQIAQLFRIPLQQLVAANPHIPNPNLIFPGDVLCVPGLVPFPCCVVLRARAAVPLGTSGVALVHQAATGGEAVTIAATLPPPATFGNFQSYTSTVFIPDVNGFGTELFSTPEEPPTWAATVNLPAVARVTPTSRVTIEPLNTETGVSGPVILEATLANCRM